MSVRRLAEPALQPASFAFNEANADWAKKIIKRYPEGREQSAVIPLMMRAQEQEGWLTRAAIETVADMIGMAYIRALEVATFYTQFQLKPVGTRAHIQVCGTTPCMLGGSEKLMDVCRRKIHPQQFQTNADGTMSWEEVECLGACVNAPMVMIFKDTYEDLTPERFEEIIDEFAAGNGASVPVGPQNGRKASEPISGLTALRDETAVLKSTRDGEVGAAANADEAAATGAAPSRAARPKTDAAETNPALKSPSATKVEPAAEKAASVSAPTHDADTADRAEPAVEGAPRPRRRKSADTGAAEAKSPELLRGEPIGPGGKRPAVQRAAPEGEPSPDAPKPRRGKRD